METWFFVGAEALKHIQPDMSFDESGLLGAFDANRQSIYATAAKTHRCSLRDSCNLIASDF